MSSIATLTRATVLVCVLVGLAPALAAVVVTSAMRRERAVPSNVTSGGGWQWFGTRLISLLALPCIGPFSVGLTRGIASLDLVRGTSGTDDVDRSLEAERLACVRGDSSNEAFERRGKRLEQSE